MASITFSIHYATQWGEDLFLESLTVQGRESGEARDRPLWPMRYAGDGYWSLTLQRAFEGEGEGGLFAYRYFCRDRHGDLRREPLFRQLAAEGQEQFVRDSFLAPELPDGAFLRQAFTGAIFQPARDAVGSRLCPGGRRLRLTLRAARVGRGQRLCVSGGHPRFGDWDPARAQVMSSDRYPLWVVDLPAAEFDRSVEFKFGLWDDHQGRLTEFEVGANRILEAAPADGAITVVNCEHYQRRQEWRGAGVAIPVFSLRTRQGYGIGEFADLIPFADWAADCGLHLVQLLPINDTSSDFTWKDSYPYKAISTAALHPIYLNIARAYDDCGIPLPPGYEARREALNRLPVVDYEAVWRDKLDYLKQLWHAVAPRTTNHPEFQDYFRSHGDWLIPYAAFCRLRDLHHTADFQQWGEHAVYREDRLRAWFAPGAPEWGEVMFQVWTQFHLERQWKDALAAGHARGVAFKGDLPIGINRGSVEAWTEPDLFRMDRQTGAPPDAFAVLGQNWGFPTYRWPRMEADGYAWWRRRLQRMSSVFDALRIDHILGFFRIWEIPCPHREGILGHYHPALPLSRDEIRQSGFARDPQLYAKGAVAEGMIDDFFGAAAASAARRLLAREKDGYHRLQPQFSNRQDRQTWYATAGESIDEGAIESGLERLSYEVLFLADPDQPDRFHPRINLADTALFRSLPRAEQAALRHLHDDFYHRRHTQFWELEAMKKLPVLMDASPMLICGEDLGMVPDSVPTVLRRLGLLSLEVERWPKQTGHPFGNPAHYPYLSVCTTSTHDMSTVRGWWEEEPAVREQYFRQVMQRDGPAPADASPEICRVIVEHNLASASMWCILPLQDWLSIDPHLRHPIAAEERINVPGNPRHYWRYRMHLTVEALRAARGFNRAVAALVEASGRSG